MTTRSLPRIPGLSGSSPRRTRFESGRRRRTKVPPLCESFHDGTSPACWRRQPGSAARPLWHENSALTEVGYCGPRRAGCPGRPWPAISTNQVHTGGPKSAGDKKAAAEGPLSGCQKTPAECSVHSWASHAGRGMPMGRGCNMLACRHHPTSRLGTSRARVGASATAACPDVSLCSRKVPAQVLTNEAQQPDPYRRRQRSRRANGACAQITNEGSVRSE
jgi:hypothetical protein